MSDVTKNKKINGKHVYVTKLYGDGEEGQFFVLIANNENVEKPYVHTGDRVSSEKFIRDKVENKKIGKDR